MLRRRETLSKEGTRRQRKPHLFPSGSARITTLAIGDFAFIASVFIMGEEFWEKLRRIFVWEGK